MIDFPKNTIFKALYLGGILKDMCPDGIALRSRNKYKRIILFCFAPLALIWGLLIKCYGVIDCLRKDCHHKKYKFAVVLIAKNESEYIEEWLAFHKIIGVDCVFLYDNDSTDNMKDVIQPYIDKGFVVYNAYPGKCKQLEVYNDALKRYGSLCHYLAFIDCDEFIMPADHNRNVIDMIDEAFRKDMNAGGLGINWAIFGSSGHKTKTPGLVMERFLYRSNADFSPNSIIKSIVKPSMVKRFSHPHYPKYTLGHYGINMNGEIIGLYYNYIEDFPSLKLNHYYTKSKEEWDKRRSFGKVYYQKDEPPIVSDDYYYRCDLNDIKDDNALFYCEKVKEMINHSFQQN